MIKTIMRLHKRSKAILAAVLAILIFGTQLPFSALATTGGEAVLYDGSNISKVSTTDGADISISVKESATQYGDALAINPTLVQGGGWAKLALDDAANMDFTKTSGIAMYVKIPDVTATNFSVRVINDAWSNWAEIGTNVTLTYVTKDGVKSTELQELPFGNKQGFEGFVFVPYEALTAGSDPGTAVTSLMDAADWNIEIGYYKWNADEIGPDYLYDCVGIYTDIDAYIEAASAQLLVNKIALDGSSAEGVTIKGGSDVSVSVVDNATQYGDALAINPTLVQGGGWAALPLDNVGAIDFTNTKGVAMYVKIPDVTATNFSVRVIDDAWEHWAEIGSSVTLTYVALDGTKTEKTHLPFADMQGFEGFVFIPYEALTSGSNPGTAVTSLMTAADWNIEIGYYKWNADEIGPDYLYDSIGLYSDIDTYIKLAESQKGVNKVVFNGDTAEGVNVVGGTDVSVAVKEDATAHGDALAINPTLVQGGGWAAVPFDNAGEMDFTNTKGIAMYVKIPDVTATNLQLRIIDNGWNYWASIGTSVTLTYVSLDGTKTTKTQLPFADMQGFEGFVFIPHEALTDGNISGTEILSKLNATDWNLEIGYYKWNADEIGPDYLYDCIGFYSDIDSYIKLAGMPAGLNVIANKGSDLTTVTTTDGADVSVSVKQNATIYGDALAINPTKVQGGGWAKVGLDSAGAKFDFTRTKGIAMYVKIPDVTMTNLTVRVINDAWSNWAEIGTNVTLTYVATDGTKTVKTQEYPFENMQGFEGFVFIPYEALTAGSNPGKAVTSLMNAADWNIEIGYYKWNADEIGPDYLYDSLGLYSDIDTYIALAEDQIAKTEYMLYDGTTTDGVSYMGGTAFEYKSVASATEKYGYALAINPTVTGGSGWAKLALDNAAGADFTTTSGIAFYTKLPDVTETNFVIRVINDQWSRWAEIGTGVTLTFVDKDGVKTTKQQNAPLEDMGGFEGFVFIPYEALTQGTAAGKSVTSEMNAADWNIEISPYKTSDECIGVNFFYDNIGIYSDIDEYIALCDKHTEVAPEPEPEETIEGGDWVANNGELDTIVIDAGVDIEKKQAATASRYGKGVALNPTKVQGSGWAEVNINKPTSFDFKNTAGVAMYVRFPEGVTATNLTIRLIKNDWSDWYTVNINIPVVLIDKDGTKTEKTQYLPFENLQGYEGFIFFPYEAFTDGRVKEAPAPEVFNDWSDWSLEIGYYKWNEDEIGKDYIYDCIGFYSTPESFVQMMNDTHPNLIANTGVASTTKVTGGTTNADGSPDVKIEEVANATQFGTALSISPTKTFSGNWGAVSVDKPENFKFDNTAGVAAYIKFPASPIATNLTIRIIKDDWSAWCEIGTGVNVTTVSYMGEKATVNQFLPFENLQGFEGFIFIPYSAFYAGSQQVDTKQLNEWTDWSIEIGYYKSNQADVAEYLFDNIGFYHDIDEYIALCGFVATDKPSDTEYYTTSSDDEGWFVVNNMYDTNATTFGGYGASTEKTTDTADNKGLLVYAQSDYRLVFKSFRVGDTALKDTAGLYVWLKADEAIAGVDLVVGITDEANPEAIEYYEFDSYEGDYYYSDANGKMYKVSRDAVRLPANFEGYVYFPFDTFLAASGSVPDNLVVDPDAITKIQITAEKNNAEQGNSQIIVDTVGMYKSQDLLDTMVGPATDPRAYTIVATGEGSAYVSIAGENIRIYDADMTFGELAEILKVKTGDVTLQLLDEAENPVNPEDKVTASFIVAVVRNDVIISRIPAGLVSDDIVADKQYVIKEGTEGVADKEITVTNKVWVDEFADDEDPYLSVKQSAAAFVEKTGARITVKQNMAAVRFLSAFNINAETVELYDADGNIAEDSSVVDDGFALKLKDADGNLLVTYRVVSTVDNDTQSTDTPATNEPNDDDDGFNAWWIVLIVLGGLVVIAAIVLLVILLAKKRK